MTNEFLLALFFIALQCASYVPWWATTRQRHHRMMSDESPDLCEWRNRNGHPGRSCLEAWRQSKLSRLCMPPRRREKIRCRLEEAAPHRDVSDIGAPEFCSVVL